MTFLSFDSINRFKKGRFGSVDILPVIWCGGKDFARFGGDDATIYVKASNLEKNTLRHLHALHSSP